MATESTPSFIIRTKLHRPRGAGGLALLVRAQESLSADLDRPFTLVCAPAGFGKTTVLCEWLANSPRPSAWLSIDERDNDLVTFLSYFVAAIRTIFPDACTELQSLLQGAVLPPLPLLSATLNNEVDSLADTAALSPGQRFILVLDDYHRISSQAVHQLLNDLLLHPPRPLHLAIAARYAPPLALAALRASNQLVEIRSSALRFTNAEIAAFLQQVLRFPVDQQTVELIERRTEGWAAGLRFTALALNAKGDADLLSLDVPGESHFVLEYLLTEVLAHLPPATQTFLMKTAILERLCGPLCEALVWDSEPVENCQRLLEWLARENMFTVALDNQGQWFRTHHLFQRLLQEQLARQCRADEIADLHYRASAWYGRNGYVEEALHHALMAGDMVAAAHLVETHRHAAMNHSQFQRLEQWLHLLSPQSIADRPGLLVLEAWLMQYRWQLADVAAHLDGAEVLTAQNPLPDPEQGYLQSEIDALRSYLRFYAVDCDEALTLAARSLQHAPMSYSAVRGYAWMVYIGAHQLMGDLEGARQAVHESLKEDKYHGNTFAVSPLISYCGGSWMAADLTAVQQSASHLLKLTCERNLVGNQLWAYHYLGCAAYQLNDLEGAELAFDAIVRKRHMAHGLVFWQGAMGLASVYLAQGAVERAEALSDSLLSVAWEMGGANAQQHALVLQAFLAERQGDETKARRWADIYDRSRPLQPMTMFSAAPLLLARILLAQGTAQSLAEATGWLSRLDDFVVMTHNTRYQIEVLALQAMVLAAQDEEAAALVVLKQAVLLAEAGGLVRVFLDLGTPMAVLLVQLAKDGVAPAYLARLCGAFPSVQLPVIGAASPVVDSRGANYAAGAGVPEPLTHREQEVLELLAQHLTAGEIAHRLVISEKTVKRHRSNIYQKFGVNRLRDALAAARALGFLA